MELTVGEEYEHDKHGEISIADVFVYYERTEVDVDACDHSPSMEDAKETWVEFQTVPPSGFGPGMMTLEEFIDGIDTE